MKVAIDSQTKFHIKHTLGSIYLARALVPDAKPVEVTDSYKKARIYFEENSAIYSSKLVNQFSESINDPDQLRVLGNGIELFSFLLNY